MASDEVVSVLYGKQHHSGHRRLSLQLESLNRIVVWSSGEKNGGKMVVQPTALLVPTRLAEWDGVEDYFQGLEEVPSCELAGKALLLFLRLGQG